MTTEQRPSGTPTATGRRSASGAIAFERYFPASVDDVWAAVTDPDRTARWIGRWSGDPASGTVHLVMDAEDGAPAEDVEIVECEPPRSLVVRTGPDPEDPWELRLTVEPVDGGARLTLTQCLGDPDLAASVGPGWDYYLDRLVTAESGGDPDGIAFEPGYTPGLAEHYRRLVSEE